MESEQYGLLLISCMATITVAFFIVALRKKKTASRYMLILLMSLAYVIVSILSYLFAHRVIELSPIMVSVMLVIRCVLLMLIPMTYVNFYKESLGQNYSLFLTVLPVIIMMAALAVNLFYPYIYSVNDLGQLKRLAFYQLPDLVFMATQLMVLISLLLTVKKKENRDEFKWGYTAACLLLQIIACGLHYVIPAYPWVSAAISLSTLIMLGDSSAGLRVHSETSAAGVRMLDDLSDEELLQKIEEQGLGPIMVEKEETEEEHAKSSERLTKLTTDLARQIETINSERKQPIFDEMSYIDDVLDGAQAISREIDETSIVDLLESIEPNNLEEEQQQLTSAVEQIQEIQSINPLAEQATEEEDELTEFIEPVTKSEETAEEVQPEPEESLPLEEEPVVHQGEIKVIDGDNSDNLEEVEEAYRDTIAQDREEERLHQHLEEQKLENSTTISVMTEVLPPVEQPESIEVELPHVELKEIPNARNAENIVGPTEINTPIEKIEKKEIQIVSYPEEEPVVAEQSDLEEPVAEVEPEEPAEKVGLVPDSEPQPTEEPVCEETAQQEPTGEEAPVSEEINVQPEPIAETAEDHPGETASAEIIDEPSQAEEKEIIEADTPEEDEVETEIDSDDLWVTDETEAEEDVTNPVEALLVEPEPIEPEQVESDVAEDNSIESDQNTASETESETEVIEAPEEVLISETPEETAPDIQQSSAAEEEKASEPDKTPEITETPIRHPAPMPEFLVEDEPDEPEVCEEPESTEDLEVQVPVLPEVLHIAHPAEKVSESVSEPEIEMVSAVEEAEPEEAAFTEEEPAYEQLELAIEERHHEIENESLPLFEEEVEQLTEQTAVDTETSAADQVNAEAEQAAQPMPEMEAYVPLHIKPSEVKEVLQPSPTNQGQYAPETPLEKLEKKPITIAKPKLRHEGQRILVVDDDERECEQLRQALARQGYDVRTISDALFALETLQGPWALVYNGIIMSHNTAMMSGIEATRQIRRCMDPEIAGLPIIGILDNDPFLIANATRNGMNDYCIRPLIGQQAVNQLDKYISEC